MVELYLVGVELCFLMRAFENCPADRGFLDAPTPMLRAMANRLSLVHGAELGKAQNLNLPSRHNV